MDLPVEQVGRDLGAEVDELELRLGPGHRRAPRSNVADKLSIVFLWPAQESVFWQREDEQRAALARPEHAGQEALRPRAPAGRHGDVLPPVDAVAARARVVPAAALELPQQLTGLGVERVELARRLAAEHEVATGREQRGAHRDVVLPAPRLLAGARVERADGPGHVVEVPTDAGAPVRDALLEVPPPARGRRADVLHGAVEELGVRVVASVRPFLGAGRAGPEVHRV